MAETAEKRKRRVNSVGLNDGDKNGERANGGKKRKRDNSRAKGKKRKKCRERERKRESKRRKSSLVREC